MGKNPERDATRNATKEAREAVVAAFEQISKNKKYQGRWILDEDIVNITKLEYALPKTIDFGTTKLNIALRYSKFRFAADRAGQEGGVFREDHDIEQGYAPGIKKRANAKFYFLADEKLSPPGASGQAKTRYKHETFETSRMNISAEEQSDFLQKMRIHTNSSTNVEKRTPPSTPEGAG
jgi:hypothetical protein